MTKYLICAAIALGLGGLGGCVVAPPGYYGGYAPGYYAAPAYYYAPSVGIGIGGGHWR